MPFPAPREVFGPTRGPISMSIQGIIKNEDALKDKPGSATIDGCGRRGPSAVGVPMPQDVARDQLAIIRIEGMHCHKCEQTIQRAMLRHEGVHEVEVDFASGQASVLFDRS